MTAFMKVRHRTMYPPQLFYSVMCPRGDKTAHVVVMGADAEFYLSLGWVEQYRLKVKNKRNPVSGE